jgi:hypothetical protein
VKTATPIVLAFLLILAGHITRALRHATLLNNTQTLVSRTISACGAGQIADLFMPYRLGELVRAVVIASDKSIRLSHVLASLIVERCLDILFIACISTLLITTNILDEPSIANVSTVYLLGLLSVSIVILLGLWKSSISRRVIWTSSKLLSQQAQFSYLSFVLSLVDSLKLILRGKIWVAVAAMSGLMWSLYLSAYFVIVFTELLSVELIVKLFRATSIASPRIFNFRYLGLVAVFGPSLMLLVPNSNWNKLSKLLSNALSSFGHSPAGHLPFVSRQTEQEFLARYFLSADRNWCSAYRAVYAGVFLVSDCSGLSSATTTRVLHRDGRITYRKFQIGEGYRALESQYRRMNELSKGLPMAPIVNSHHGNNFFAYDMPYAPTEVTFSEALHQLSTDESLQLTGCILNDLDSYFDKSDSTMGSSANLHSFTDGKLRSSLHLLSSHAQAKQIVIPTELTFNDKNVLGLETISRLPSFQRALSLLSEETLGTIHGDLTLDNIVVDMTDSARYFLIDPVTEIALPSRTHDLAKLLQSTVTRQTLTTQYTILGAWTSSVSFRVVDEPRLATFSDQFVMRYISNRQELEQITLRIRLMVHWVRLVVHRINRLDPHLELYLGALLAIWNNCAADLEQQSYSWQKNYCVI